MTRTEFLMGRRKGIGSSDVAKILGISPWGNALDVYLEKVHPPSAGPLAPQLEWGIRCEPVIAAAIIDKYGWELAKPTTHIHPQYQFLLASPDRMNDAGEVIEIKTARTDQGWGEPETAEIPDHYWLQVQHQLEVMHQTHESQVAWVFVLIGNADFRRYRVARDESYLSEFLEPLREFWQDHVEKLTPPEPDWTHPGTHETLNRLHKPDPGKTVELPASAALWADEYEILGGEIKRLSEERDIAKARLIDAMTDAQTGTLNDGRTVVRRTIDRKEYTVAATSYTDFRIKHPKGGK